MRRFPSYWMRMSRMSTQETFPENTSQVTPENGCVLQSFEWHTPADQKQYQRLLKSLPEYKRLGITALWLPPACKASSPEGNGYDIYDLWDLGEFDQQGSVGTKWGTRDDLIKLSEAAKENGIQLYFDAVLGHKAGADRIEKVKAVKVDENDRNKEIEEEKEIETWTAFDFPGRKDKYSAFKYNSSHFNGVDWDQATNENAIYRLSGKQWTDDTDLEKGNYEYLMFSNLDYSNQEVVDDVLKWGVWVTDQLSLGGFRLDAARHMSRRFMDNFITHVREQTGKPDLMFIGEFWKYSTSDLCNFIDALSGKCLLYDCSLLNSFMQQSHNPQTSDMRTLFDNTLVQHRPCNSVTLVMNHDTQPGQVMDSPVAYWFRPLAYALILLRKDGYPCIFFGDMYGIKGPRPFGSTCEGRLGDLILARKQWAYGRQRDYFDSADTIGWVRMGTHDRRDGLAVLMTNGPKGRKRVMNVGKRCAGQVWVDIWGKMRQEVKIDRRGYGQFHCPAQGVAVWINREAGGREELGRFSNDFFGGV